MLQKLLLLSMFALLPVSQAASNHGCEDCDCNCECCDNGDCCCDCEENCDCDCECDCCDHEQLEQVAV